MQWLEYQVKQNKKKQIFVYNTRFNVQPVQLIQSLRYRGPLLCSYNELFINSLLRLFSLMEMTAWPRFFACLLDKYVGPYSYEYS